LSRCIFNDQTLGQYDFGFQQIEISNKDNGKSVEDIERIINTRDLDILSGTELEIFKTYKHETTHLLDSTSTLWGMEYTCRMYNWFNTPSDEYLKVISLNDAEIQMHTKLLQNLNAAQHFSKLKYSLEYDEQCGVFVHMHYLNEYDGLIQSTPVTMLSLLEGHAYSQEQLISCDLYAGNLVSSSLLVSKVNDDINSLNGSEYSCFLAMVSQLFPELELRQKLLIMILISRFSLNVPTFFISSFPEDILSHIFSGAPQELISALKMEMSRGMHRCTLCLVLMLCLAIHSESTERITDSTTLEQMERVLLKVFQRHNQTIENVRSSLILQYELEFELLTELLNEKGACLAKQIAEQFKGKNWYFDDLNTLQLPDFFLSNGNKVQPSIRIDYDIEEHMNNMLEKVVELERSLKELGIARQHLYPHVYHDWLNRIKSGETGIRYYPEASNGL